MSSTASWLTRAELGASEWGKAIYGRRGHYAGNPAGGTPNGCRNCAGYAGAQAALSLHCLRSAQHIGRSAVYLDQHADDARMFAMQAFRAWRSYRSFGKDLRP